MSDGIAETGPAPAVAGAPPPDWLDDESLYEGAEGDEARASRRALLVRLAGAGLTKDALSHAVKEGRLATLPAELALAGDTPYTLTEVARAARLDSRFLRQVLLALGRPNPAHGERAFTDEDVEDARILRQFLDAGLPRAELLQVTRVLGHGMANTAVAIRELVADALLKSGDSELDSALRYAAAAEHLGPLLAPLLGHELQVHIREVVRRETVTQAERESGTIRGTRTIAVGFGDLVGFTKLGGEMPPDQLGRIATRLADLGTTAARPPVQLVKTIGDAVMLASPKVDPLIDALDDLVRAVDKEGEDFPGLRAGVAYGEALPRGGDWFGSPVNLASRLTAAAKPGTISVAAEAQEAATRKRDWSRRRRKMLKGCGRVAYYRLTPL